MIYAFARPRHWQPLLRSSAAALDSSPLVILFFKWTPTCHPMDRHCSQGSSAANHLVRISTKRGRWSKHTRAASSSNACAGNCKHLGCNRRSLPTQSATSYSRSTKHISTLYRSAYVTAQYSGLAISLDFVTLT